MQEPERLRLAHTPTPLQKLERLSREVGKEIWVWRDDLTGFAESGNKIRKLEFLLAEARREKATRLITCGGPQSNHARATAVLARRLGMEVTLVIREPQEGLDKDAPQTGNALINRLLGAECRYVPFSAYREAGSVYDPFLAEASEIARRRGEVPYVVAEGGSSPLGCFGYLHAASEFAETWKKDGPKTPRPDQLFFALGSGGTFAGLVLGFSRLGWPIESLCAVNVCDDEAYFQARVGRLLSETEERYGVRRAAGPLRIFDGHVGEGYARATDEDLLEYARIARLEGLLLDPVYTGKAFRGMLREIARRPEEFGRHIVFLHSGGIFAQFAFAERVSRLVARA